MFTLRRKVFVLSIAIAVFVLVVIQFNFQPWNTATLQLLINKTQHSNKLLGNIPLPLYSKISISETESQSQTPATKTPQPTPQPAPLEKILVVAKLKSDDTGWIERYLPSWKTAIYTVDDTNAALHTSVNKGHEANVYLTYIINNYAQLPDVMIFIHSHQKHKHGTRDFHGIDYVKRTGYVNLRCLVNPGCPAEIQPFRPDEERDPLRPQENAMASAWNELFGNNNVPQVLATPCCAQFGVSRETVLKRPKEEYERFLNWLHNTPLDDFTSGRIFEYLWHVIFGRQPVYCPSMDQCYKDQYGTTASVVHQDQEKKQVD